MSTRPKVQVVCATCKSSDVRRDATASWDVEAQDWDLAGVQDQGYCESCARETTLVDVPLQERLDYLNSFSRNTESELDESITIANLLDDPED